MTSYLVGIDGGGTSCRAAVASPDGRILGRGKSGAANILTDPETALQNIAGAARAAFEDARLDPAGIAAARAIVGVAGHNVGDAVHYVKRRLPFAQADIESDGLIALQGALGDGDGAVAILGTGTIYIARRGEVVGYIGGWGFTIGDHGSGARIGHALLQETLLAYDGIHAASPVTDSVLLEFNNDPRDVVDFARLAKPGEFGRYAPRVFDHAGSGDPVATRLLKAAATTVDEALDVVVARGARTICLLGGLAPLYRPWLAERHQPHFVEAEADALTGAVALAAQRFGTRPEIVA
ncbi:N-acetylglucosamine kinase [Sinorhizobium alkalisoli]|uniref:N-acetylglucosamine kinase n=1 Tax=Sinorhizobium alkalisoli TaxID=1752398 RepID=A0A1E3V9B4_9HYPH|nr:N-acetylglucosamine kinase [Sinorhizobium alkalisoli]MCA1490066.1 N-acetylglucosamine kinase [Ensifer sp. NBAIM29]MCG5480710.1 N-acetylglucosamine kinase [Sinorhizobium alkalisoli]ODR90233.1 N-acetylglucosamine kinase [Sinorhizobium alkalisoli]QFI68266.1 N-acetylglucosamine kinase of eukaryotic type [Sinorhizobium alkalisoli]